MKYMNADEVIEELKQFPAGSRVFMRQVGTGIQPIDSVHAISTQSEDGGMFVRFVEERSDAEDFGVLLYG